MTTIRVLLFVACFLLLASCGQNWETVDVPQGTTMSQVLALDIYAPFRRAVLLRDPESTYGPSKDSGSEGEGSHHVFYSEYVGKHGRIRIYDEALPTHT